MTPRPISVLKDITSMVSVIIAYYNFIVEWIGQIPKSLPSIIKHRDPHIANNKFDFMRIIWEPKNHGDSKITSTLFV